MIWFVEVFFAAKTFTRTKTIEINMTQFIGKGEVVLTIGTTSMRFLEEFDISFDLQEFEEFFQKLLMFRAFIKVEPSLER